MLMNMISRSSRRRSPPPGLARSAENAEVPNCHHHGIVFLAWTAFAVGLFIAVFSKSFAAPSEPPHLIQFLEQTIGWYRQLGVEQQIATEPNDAMVVHDNQQIADQVVQLAFDFARAETALTTKPTDSNQTAGESSGSSQHRALVQMAATLGKDVQDLQGEVESVKQKLATASGTKRRHLQSALAETQSELELAEARRDAVRSMMEFVVGASTNGLGATGARAQIEALARSVPGALAKPATSKEGGNPVNGSFGSVPVSGARKAEPSGIWALGADLLALSRRIHALDETVQLTDALAQSSNELRGRW